MTRELIFPILIGFFLSSIIGPRLLPVLTRLKFGQFVRDDGPESHLKKQGTPTMGGIIFLAAIVLGALIYLRVDSSVLPLLLMTIGFGIVGFVDDYLKVVKKQSEGLKAWQKFSLQMVVSIGFLVYLVMMKVVSTSIIIPFTYGYELDLSYVYIPFMLIVILGTVNGVNLTDGLDGLAASVTSVVAFFYVLIAGTYGFTGGVFSGIVLGSLLGFCFSMRTRRRCSWETPDPCPWRLCIRSRHLHRDTAVHCSDRYHLPRRIHFRDFAGGLL